MADAISSRERECKTLQDENRSLTMLYQQLKADSDRLTTNQDSLIKNLRLQLDETREVISNLKDNKEREFKKLRDKCDEEIRRETDKYQFEFDKQKDEISMYQRRLG
jgi:nitrate/nitrite-specific signal transduction histidine kinase